MFNSASFLFLFLGFAYAAAAQTLPINFEGDIATSNFEDFDGGVAQVIPNPFSDSFNPSANVAQIVRDGGEVWAGSKFTLEAPMDFSVNTLIHMNVYTTAPVGTTVRLKLEGGGELDNDAETTVSGAWETLIWDYTGQPMIFTDLVFMFDFGNYGDGSETSTFYFDDIKQSYSGEQLDLPVTFEGFTTNYNLTDFGGNISSVIPDPDNAENTIAEVIRLESAISWAGTTIGTPGGFVSEIPFSASETQMSIRFWSPEMGANIRLKVENWADPGQTCETETTTTVAQGWETLVFDFDNEVAGTPTLSQGLSSGWYFNKASIFYQFGSEGAEIGEQLFYFDDLYFGLPPLVGIAHASAGNHPRVFVQSSTGHVIVDAGKGVINACEVYALSGKCLVQTTSNLTRETVDVSGLPVGVYVVKVVFDGGQTWSTKVAISPH